ncbi:MAG: GTPase domain-containing protein [Acidobacteriota bacterium]
MVLFNYATKEITAKVVYYGPGLCGKTTNLQFIYESLPSSSRSKMLSLATETDRTLFFDFLPIELGRIRGMRTRLQLYTVPGQVFYNSTRQLVLRGADGVVFVADSQQSALDANRESLLNLEENLKKQSIRIAEIPLVIQYNKRDLPSALPVPVLEAELNHFGFPSFESIATTGSGIEETLNGISRTVLENLIQRYGLDDGEPMQRDVLGPASAPSSPEESLWVEQAVPDPTESAIPIEVPAQVRSALPEPASAFDGPSIIDSPQSDSLNFDDTPDLDDIPETAVDLEWEEVDGPMTARALESSLPDPAPPPPPPAGNVAVAMPDRSAESLVKEVTLPLNLTLDEIQRFRKLKIRITLDVNLLK